MTKFPKIAGATLSGCPSIFVAMANLSAADKLSCPNWLASSIPATITELDDPRPRAKGISLVILIL